MSAIIAIAINNRRSPIVFKTSAYLLVGLVTRVLSWYGRYLPFIIATHSYIDLCYHIHVLPSIKSGKTMNRKGPMVSTYGHVFSLLEQIMCANAVKWTCKLVFVAAPVVFYQAADNNAS